MSDEDYAVVFSGGGALGSWEVGCLDAVIDYHCGRFPSVITGASAGAINAAGLCAGMGVKELAETWANLTDSDIYAARSFRWKLIKAAFGFAIGKGLVESCMAQIKTVQSVFDTAPLNATLQRILEAREHGFLNSRATFAISTTRLADSEPELFYKMPVGSDLPADAVGGRYKTWTKITGLALLLQALRGTSALPMLFPPMEGRFDGGVLLNQPIAPAIRLGARNLFVFIPSVEAIGDTGNMLAIGSTMLTTWLAMSLSAQIEQIKLRNKIREYINEPNAFPSLRVCVIRPSLDLGKVPGVGLLSFGKHVGALIDAGRKSGVERLRRYSPTNPGTWY